MRFEVKDSNELKHGRQTADLAGVLGVSWGSGYSGYRKSVWVSTIEAARDGLNPWLCPNQSSPGFPD